jgi:hypothetical protein
MKIVTEGNVIRCPHPPGAGTIVSTQDFVRIGGRKIVVRPNPVRTVIAGCPNVAIPNIPCTATMTAEPESYSAFLSIGAAPVCLDRVRGVTSGSPPGMPKYGVVQAGQEFVEVSS